jgi:hypothetical protein
MLIEITAVPIGPAPDWVKKEWVGVRMEAMRPPVETVLGETSEKNFITGENHLNRGGFIVKIEDAINALTKKSRLAANWFRENVPSRTSHLSFGPNEAIIVP